MLKFSYKGISVISILDERKATKDNLYPVKVRIIENRVAKYYPLNIYLTQEDWDILLTTKKKPLIEKREMIQSAFNIISEQVKELALDDKFSFETLNKRLGKGSTDTLNTAFNAKISYLKNEGKISTSDWYYYALKSISEFAGEKIYFNQISIDWLKRFESHLLDKGKSYTTVSMYMRALQTIINEAKRLGIIKEINHPFGKGKYEIPQHEGRNMALSITDIGKITLPV